MQALHRAARAGLELDRNDAPAGLDQKIDLTRSSTFALPVEQPRSVARRVAAEQEGLTYELLGELPADGGREVVPRREPIARRRVGEGMEQADVEQDGLPELVGRIAAER